MTQPELCHWLLLEPSGNCRSVFAPPGDTFDDYRRIGAMASSPQFVLPLCFAASSSLVRSEIVQAHAAISIEFTIYRDDREAKGPAFADMSSLKVAMLLSEFSAAVAQWVSAVGCEFEAVKLPNDDDGVFELRCKLKDANYISLERAKCLIRAGIEMMAFARGLKSDFIVTTRIDE